MDFIQSVVAHLNDLNDESGRKPSQHLVFPPHWTARNGPITTDGPAWRPRSPKTQDSYPVRFVSAG
ncbi:hypothetical protein CKAH01_08924 [Colletotrichum kahawae]|uniref:Uncharacterized protein n=1 Tax=Colletotrichum kahawae TaxID=34407 RepID=A0AAE0CZB2_COLKA|nr:hypothetical protein CKAH01_08924 [Colletotrichum kahawae]